MFLYHEGTYQARIRPKFCQLEGRTRPENPCPTYNSASAFREEAQNTA